MIWHDRISRELHASALPAFQSARMYHPCGMHSAADIPDEQLLRSPVSASDHQEVRQNRSALRFPSMHFPDLRLPSGDFYLQRNPFLPLHYTMVPDPVHTHCRMSANG